MIWSVVTLLAAALSVDCFAVSDLYETVAHGRQLKIFLQHNAERLDFTPYDNPSNTYPCWNKRGNSVSRGRVSGTGNDRRWYIDKVTYEHQGTYSQKDYWNHEVSTVKVAVEPRNIYEKRVAGATLSISLEGIELSNAKLNFSGQYGNVTLVRQGSRVSQDLPDYFDRVRTHSNRIEIRHVNYTDEGRYYLSDHKNRVVSITRMDLTDTDEYTSGNPLLALLLLLGIPAGICCCCKNKIFKKKPPTAVVQSSPGMVHVPPSGPVGPAPPYNTPGQPGAVYYHGPNSNMGPTVHTPTMPAGPGQWNGPPPFPGSNPAYPPQNPIYPPLDPALMAPNQPPQWNGPPPGQYPPGPAAPMGYAAAPAMYSAPAPATSEYVPSPADPLMTEKPQIEPSSAPEPPPSNTLSSPENAYQFNIDGGKSSTNFL